MDMVTPPGRGDYSSEQDNDDSYLDEDHAVSEKFVAAGYDVSEPFEHVEEPFNDAASFLSAFS